MRILILANNAEGLFIFRRELVEVLVNKYEVWFSVPESADDEHVDRLCGIGAHHIQTQQLARHGTNPAQDLALFSHYRHLLQRLQPCVVLTYTIKPNVYGGLACQRERVPYIANITGLGTSIQNGGMLQRLTLGLYRRGLHGAEKVFFQNTANREFMLEHGVLGNPGAPCVSNDVLPGSGVNVTHFNAIDYPAEDSSINFITVGRIMHDKGTGELIDAARVVRAHHPEVLFRLLGSFDEDLEQVVSAATAEGLIDYIPAQSDVRPYVGMASALVHPSYHEGMSNVCLEAASIGRPVIASDIPGCRETFDEGVTGIGFEPRNVESLVDALERFITLPYAQRRAMGIAGREKVIREFDRQIVIDKYLAEIEKIAKEHQEQC